MPSRVSTAQVFSGAQAQVATVREREQLTAEKASTLKEINRPSQDPAGWMTARSLKDLTQLQDIMAKNADSARHWLAASENGLKQIQEYLQKGHEVALRAADGHAQGEAVQETLLAEAQGLFESLLSALNSRYGDRSLFGGFKTAHSPFNLVGKYEGDSGRIEVDIEPKNRVTMNVSAEQAILGNTHSGGVDIPANFKLLIRGLTTRDPETIRSSIEGFLRGVDQISVARAQVGSRMNEIDRAISANGAERIERLGAISKIEEADTAKVFSNLVRDQTALSAALATTKKILTEVPLDSLYK